MGPATQRCAPSPAARWWAGEASRNINLLAGLAADDRFSVRIEVVRAPRALQRTWLQHSRPGPNSMLGRLGNPLMIHHFALHKFDKTALLFVHYRASLPCKPSRLNMQVFSSPRIPRGAYGRRKEVRCFHEHRPTPPPAPPRRASHRTTPCPSFLAPQGSSASAHLYTRGARGGDAAGRGAAAPLLDAHLIHVPPRLAPSSHSPAPRRHTYTGSTPRLPTATAARPFPACFFSRGLQSATLRDRPRPSCHTQATLARALLTSRPGAPPARPSHKHTDFSTPFAL